MGNSITASKLRIEKEGISGRTITDEDGEDILQNSGIGAGDDIDISGVDTIHKESTPSQRGQEGSETLVIEPEGEEFTCSSSTFNSSEYVKSNKLGCDGGSI